MEFNFNDYVLILRRQWLTRVERKRWAEWSPRQKRNQRRERVINLKLREFLVTFSFRLDAPPRDSRSGVPGKIIKSLIIYIF
jgi:hypothetical protein